MAYYRPFLYDITPFVERDRQEIDLNDFYPEILRATQMEGQYYQWPRWIKIRGFNSIIAIDTHKIVSQGIDD